MNACISRPPPQKKNIALNRVLKSKGSLKLMFKRRSLQLRDSEEMKNVMTK